MKTYTELFSQVTVGNMIVKNRIFMAPMSTHLANEKGEVTKELLAYYTARAKGGVGYITIPSMLIEKLSRYGTYRNLCLYEDWHIDNLKKLTTAVHHFGTKIGAQLLHPSTACPPEYNEGRIPVAATPVEARAYSVTPRSLSAEEIENYVILFAEAAKRAQLAGFDAIEIHCCHRHGLLGNFLSPLHNKRIDEYGGNVEGRLRFPLKVISKVREYVGEEFPIIIRMSATDEEPGGQSLLEGCYIAKEFEKAGASMINLSNGSLDIPWKTTAPSGSPQGLNAELARKIKSGISIPLGVVGRINEPWIAEMMLENGDCDICYIGRALICDPDFPRKAALGKDDCIRPCIGCLQCLHAANTDQEFGCTVNPAAGHELQISKPSSFQKNILVVGGGPGGLSVARYAAEKGHKVTLIEKSDHLGGQMYLAAIPPCKQEITKATRYMIKKLESFDVDIQLNTSADIFNIKKGDFDLVIVATGNEAIVPGFLQGAASVITAREALEASKPVGHNVVIIGGGSVGCETADYLIHPHFDLSANGRRVTIIEQTDILDATDKTAARPLLIDRLIKKGCNLLTGCKVVSVDGTKIVYEQNQALYTIENVDTVIAAIGSKVNNVLEESLKKHKIPYKVLTQSQTIKSSIYEGFQFIQENL